MYNCHADAGGAVPGLQQSKMSQVKYREGLTALLSRKEQLSQVRNDSESTNIAEPTDPSSPSCSQNPSHTPFPVS